MTYVELPEGLTPGSPFFHPLRLSCGKEAAIQRAFFKNILRQMKNPLNLVKFTVEANNTHDKNLKEKLGRVFL